MIFAVLRFWARAAVADGDKECSVPGFNHARAEVAACGGAGGHDEKVAQIEQAGAIFREFGGCQRGSNAAADPFGVGHPHCTACRKVLCHRQIEQPALPLFHGLRRAVDGDGAPVLPA